MKEKTFDIITTVIGLLGAIWYGILPILQGDMSWDKLILAVLTAVLGYFSQKKK